MSSVAEHRKDVMCLREEIHVLDEFRSGVCDSTVDSDFCINELTINIK